MNFGRATFCIHTLYRLTINSDENFAIALMCFWCVKLCGCLHRQAHIYCSVSPAFFAFRCARSFPFHSVAFTTQVAISYIYILLSLIVHKSHTKTSHVQWTLLTFDEWEKERERVLFLLFFALLLSHDSQQIIKYEEEQGMKNVNKLNRNANNRSLKRIFFK